MKKLKLLPTILMLVLCVGVLAIGIYAITPTKNTISGSITINASSHNVLITAHHVPYGTTDFATVCTEANQIGGLYDLRSGGTIDLTKESLNFIMDGVNDLTHANVQPRLIVLKLQNPSTTQALGAYFSEDKTINAQLTDSAKILTSYNVPTVKEDETSTTSMATATLSKYIKIPKKSGSINGVAFATIQIALNDLPTEKLYLKPNFAFNIEEFNSSFITSEVRLNKNDNNVNVTASTLNSVTQLTNQPVSDVWEFSLESASNSDALQTTVVKFKVQNANSTSAISVDVVMNEYSNSKVTVTEVDNPYIPAGQSGEVSLQFTYNVNDSFPREDAGDGLDEFKCSINISQVEEPTKTAKQRIETLQDPSEYLGGVFKYYINFGEYNGTPLRWFIYGYLDHVGSADGEILSINAEGAPDPTTSEDQYTYYFISEYILQKAPFYYEFDYCEHCTFTYIEDDYYSSLIKDYINGITVRDNQNIAHSVLCGCCDDCLINYFCSYGQNVNFYKDFKLNSDPLFNKVRNSFYLPSEIETGLWEGGAFVEGSEGLLGEECLIAKNIKTNNYDDWFIRSSTGDDPNSGEEVAYSYIAYSTNNEELYMCWELYYPVNLQPVAGIRPCMELIF